MRFSFLPFGVLLTLGELCASHPLAEYKLRGPRKEDFEIIGSPNQNYWGFQPPDPGWYRIQGPGSCNQGATIIQGLSESQALNLTDVKGDDVTSTHESIQNAKYRYLAAFGSVNDDPGKEEYKWVIVGDGELQVWSGKQAKSLHERNWVEGSLAADSDSLKARSLYECPDLSKLGQAVL
ncbi:hypothetical protein EV356DRAFT_529734 [Viridothelium virens]|uniref:Uncharacterized protein n=1 Tax=Viridothelium virens TaxID=1048519 RepID=A0A6A6HI96_VIRVR|nr:hypothetical protein EV356DRAFT_529734 [Viridothelium virens]